MKTPPMRSHLEGFPADMNTLDLVAEPPHDTNFVSLRDLSDEQEQALIERARSGDQAARDEMFLWLLSAVNRFATRYYLTHSWQVAGGISPDDLASEASLRMLERFSLALAASNPFAYLLQVAYKTICGALWQGASSIRTPYTPGVRPIPVKSLHAPLTASSEDTLLDVLPADDLMRSAPDDERDYTAIYEAAASLTETERAVIAEWYGLYEIAPASMDTIISQLGRSGMGSYKAHALAKFYRLLAPAYAQYRAEGYVQELRTPGVQLSLSESQQLRLEAAYAQLQQSGQKITVHGLSRASGVNTAYASSYLREHGYMQPGRGPRLEAAYAQLQQSGQKITVRLLAQEAGVNSTYASMYLQQRTSYQPQVHVRPAEDRAPRVAKAYAQLQESGHPITRRTLGATAHVNWHYAAAYIQQMQAAAPSTGGMA